LTTTAFRVRWVGVKVLAASGLAALACWAQSAETVRREGAYWVQTATGSFAAPQLNRLKVVSRGTLTVQGGDEPGIRYTVQKRVKAADAAQAVRLFQQFELKTRRAGEWTAISVSFPEQEFVSAELMVSVPRTLAQAYLETQGGNVSAGRWPRRPMAGISASAV
jgi:hypothetical protein